MNFGEPLFLFIFLPLSVILYSVIPKKAKNVFLAVSSLVFIFLSGFLSIPVLLAASAVNYIAGIIIYKTNRKKTVLLITVAIDLAVLFSFRYFADLTNAFNGIFGTDFRAAPLFLPVGLSFFVFQAISYSADICSGKIAPEYDFIAFLNYMILFPKAVSGPIIRYGDISGQLKERALNFTSLSEGAAKFTVGLCKKIILADTLAAVITPQILRESVAGAWCFAVCSALRLYFDFSGYSDMAVGAAKMFGFEFPDNFNYPFTANSVSDFWRRWHITLSSWFRDYVYIPLGGNRKGKLRCAVNIFTVWILTGIWHGFSAGYFIWGVLFGILITAEKNLYPSLARKLPVLSGIITVLLSVTVFSVFGPYDFKETFGILGSLFGAGVKLYDIKSLYIIFNALPLIAIGAIGATPIPKRIYGKLGVKARSVITPLLIIAGLIVSAAFISSGTFTPFIYSEF